MTNEFGQRVYPIIRYVLDLLSAIRSGRTTPDPQLISTQLRTLLAQFDVKGQHRVDYHLARAALVYWIDEVLVNAPWDNADFWSNHTLERSYFDSRERAWRFFEKAESARSLENLDALETFYLCACFGFKGVYRDEGTRSAGDSAPPGSGDTWDEEQEQAAGAAKGDAAGAPAATDAAGPGDGGWWDSEEDAMQTWGIGGDDVTESLVDDLLRDASAVRAPLSQRARETQAATFQEWIDSVYRQLAPSPQPPYSPRNSPLELGHAGPLSGRSSRGAATLMLVLASLLFAGLWITILYRAA